MQVQFRKSEVGKKHTVKLDAQDFYILESHPSNWSEDCFIAVRKSAVDIVKPERTYQVGQRFRVGICRNEYILAQASCNYIAFISLAAGNRFKEPIKANNVGKITVYELNQIGSDWVLID